VRIALFLGITILAGTGGELLVAHAMRLAARTSADATTSDLTRTSGVARSGIVGLLERGLRPGAFWIGIALQAVAFFALLALLSWADLSFVVPATALNYVVGAAGSALFLREQVNRTRWAGVLLVCIGVAVMCASEL
jgi:EamA-like transporter family